MAKSDMLFRMKADTSGYDANIAKARRQLDQFKRDNLTAGGALKQLSGTLMSTAAKFASVTAAVGALGMAFKNNIETARNFEKSMSQLSSLTGMGELMKNGCTTVFDHHYVFPAGAGDLIGAQV